jgi:hypothetical protein
MPVLICRGEVVRRNPSNQQIPDCLGFNDAIDQTQIRDVVIVGVGPPDGRPYDKRNASSVLILELKCQV